VDHRTEHVTWPEVTQWMAACALARLSILAATASTLVVGVSPASAQSLERVPEDRLSSSFCSTPSAMPHAKLFGSPHIASFPGVLSAVTVGIAVPKYNAEAA